LRGRCGIEGEHRLPACTSRQLAEKILRCRDAMTSIAAGKLPAAAG
jgi:hypothetical protein